MKDTKSPRQETPAIPDARTEVSERVLETLRLIRRRGTPEQAIEAAELEKLVSARLEPSLAKAA